MNKKTYGYMLLTALIPLSSLVYAESADPSSPAATVTESTDPALATPNRLQLSYSLERYSRTFDDNPISTLQYGRLSKWGSFYLRANSVKRYETDDVQYEADIYPKLWDGGYAYVNVGTAEGTLFPRRRYGAELFASLGGGFEGSLGVRHLVFLNSTATIYTGSLSKYFSDYLFTIRPYVTPSDTGTSVSASVGLTRYFESADEYWRIRASTGKSAEERVFQNAQPEATTLKSRSISLSGQWSPLKATFISLSYDRARQELLFASGEYVSVDSFSAAISYRF